MPCSDGDYDDGRERRELVARLDRVTALLCRQCTFLEGTGRALAIDADVREWWIKHKLQDQERLRRESANRAESIRQKERQISELMQEIERMR